MLHIAVFRCQPGNCPAQKHIIERYDRAKRERRREIDDEVEWWTHYKNVLWAEMTKDRENGAVGSAYLIHPEDVVIDHEKGVSFTGPTSDEEARELEKTLALRDLMMAQDAWDSRNGRGEGDGDITVAGVVGVTLNRCVPARYQLSEVEYVDRAHRLDVTTKRELRKLLYRGFRTLGLHWKPDLMLPEVADLLRLCRELADTFGELERIA